MKRIALSILMVLVIEAVAFAQGLKYVGSNPIDGSTVETLSTVELEFDLSDVQESLGEAEWGICSNGFYLASLPNMEKTATLYEGVPEDNNVLERLNSVIKPNNSLFKVGNTFKIQFSDFEIKPNQLYTLVITYEFYAGKNGEKTWDTTTKLSFQNEPLVLTFVGSEVAEKVLSPLSNSIIEDTTYEQIPEVQISFNYDVTVNNGCTISLFEENEEICKAGSVIVDSEDNKSVLITFPETELVIGHTYNIVIPEGSFSIIDEDKVLNNEIIIPIKGASYIYFGVGRGLTPAEGSVSILDEITVPFKFPTSETKTYGLKDTGVPMTVYVYVGENIEGEELLSVEANASTDGTSLVITPNYAFEPDSEYTFVIPEGTIDVYDLGARNPTIQKDLKNERIVLHYTTPSVESLPAWEPSPLFIKNNDELSELKYYIIDCPIYEYDGTTYNTVVADKYDISDNGALYLITENGEEEIKTFRITKKILDSESEIGDGELNGSYLVGDVNEPLYEGNKYKVVWRAHDLIVNNPFIGKYIGNPEVSVMLNGTTPTSDDFGLTANIDDRLHSHADVFSFVTESEVKAGENAKMILKDGEENVAEAPVYVSREANCHRVYADFGGKKLESGKSYEVVLPEGSVYATNGIVNNPEIKSVITAMPEAPAAPEFVSIALNIDEYASATYRMVKGQESVLNLKAGDDWKLESLSLNGEDVTGEVDENGLYTLPALDEDANLDAAYTYAREINYDFETGVGNIQDVPYSLTKDGSHLLISGLNGGEQIAIYTVGGMKIASLDAVPADMHEASLALPEGQVYIILINGTSIKWKQ